MNTEDLITIREAAEIRGVTKQLVGLWIRSGLLPAQWVALPGQSRGAIWLLKRADVLAYVPVRGPYRGRKRNIQTPADREPLAQSHGQEPNGPTLPELPPGQPATTTLDPVGLAIATQ